MEKELKAELLQLLQDKNLPEVMTRLLEFIPSGHPAGRRTAQLQKRHQELEGRISMGTLSSEDIERVRARISGGLREIVLDYDPTLASSSSILHPAAAPGEEKKPSFTLKLKPESEPVKQTEPVNIGFREEVVYQGSPSKKEDTITLNKSYGASYHIAVQAVRKCGMDMEKGDRAGGKIQATSAGNTMSRFGENIYLWITPLERAKTRIHVVVDSANPEMVFDLGRHQQKLSALLHQLRNG